MLVVIHRNGQNTSVLEEDVEYRIDFCGCSLALQHKGGESQGYVGSIPSLQDYGMLSFWGYARYQSYSHKSHMEIKNEFIRCQNKCIDYSRIQVTLSGAP
jgi:hypothetical protein